MDKAFILAHLEDGTITQLDSSYLPGSEGSSLGGSILVIVATATTRISSVLMMGKTGSTKLSLAGTIVLTIAIVSDNVRLG